MDSPPSSSQQQQSCAPQRNESGLNDEAVSSLQIGCYGSSAAKLAQALRRLRQNLTEAEKQGTDTYEDCQPRSLRGSVIKVDTSRPAPRAGTAVPFSSPAAIFCYECAFRFSVEDSISRKELAAAVVLYNYALTWHLRSRSTERGSSSRGLHRALKMYGMSLAALQTIAPSRWNEGDLMLLRLAILNNMGHIAALRANYATLRLCCEEILAHLQIQSILSDEEYFFYVVNATTGLSAARRGAAAA